MRWSRRTPCPDIVEHGGPLDLSFQHCGLVHKAMDTPAHWRGTNQALAALWSKARHSREWWLWHPMTGAIARVEQNGRGSEVDLEGGMFGDTGGLSFILPTSVRCRGRWSAASGNGLVVTRAELLSQYGPRYFPGSAVPAVADSYQRLGHAFIDCDGGRTLRLEFITGPGTAHGWVSVETMKDPSIVSPFESICDGRPTRRRRSRRRRQNRSRNSFKAGDECERIERRWLPTPIKSFFASLRPFSSAACWCSSLVPEPLATGWSWPLFSSSVCQSRGSAVSCCDASSCSDCRAPSRV